MKPQSEDLLERIAFDLSVAITDAESTRAPDAEFKSRMATLCRKWRAYIETLLFSAADPALAATSKTLALQEENAALKQELEAVKKENAELKAATAELSQRPPEKPAKAAPPPKTAAPPKAAEDEQPKSEFDEAMKGVRRY